MEIKIDISFPLIAGKLLLKDDPFNIRAHEDQILFSDFPDDNLLANVRCYSR